MTVSPTSKTPLTHSKHPPTSSVPPPSPTTKSSESTFLATVEGEISFFRSIMRSRPVGHHRYFHILAIQNAIMKETGKLLHVESIWEKLQSCYDLDALDSIDFEAEGYQSLPNAPSTVTIRSPSPSENLARHPFFREEYSLPFDESFETLISQRRMRATASAPSSPMASPTPASSSTKSQQQQQHHHHQHHHHHHHHHHHQRKGANATTTTTTTTSGRRRAKSKADLAGLVGGDSDSSALTQESGDEGGGAVGTPRESVVTGTDGGTDFGEDDQDVEMKEPSPARSVSPKQLRGKSKATKKGKSRSTVPGPSTTTTRSSKKRKR